MVTQLTSKTSMPLRPHGPFEPMGPRSWSEGLPEQGGPDLVPSTITPLRSSPRRCRLGLSIKTPALGAAIGGCVV